MAWTEASKGSGLWVSNWGGGKGHMDGLRMVLGSHF